MPSDRSNLTRLKPGDSPFRGPLNAGQWNAVVDGLRGAPSSHPHPSSVATIGVIDEDSAPSTFTDNRYWVRIWSSHAQPAKGAASAAEMTGLHAGTVGDYSLQVPATNLAERSRGATSGGTHRLEDGMPILLWQVVVGANVHWVFWEVVGFMFPVLVEQTGGSAGDASTQCSFTYAVGDLLGNALGSGMTPLKARPSVGKLVATSAGGYGTGFYAADGTFKLWDANEVEFISECTA